MSWTVLQINIKSSFLGGTPQKDAFWHPPRRITFPWKLWFNKKCLSERHQGWYYQPISIFILTEKREFVWWWHHASQSNSILTIFIFCELLLWKWSEGEWRKSYLALGQVLEEVILHYCFFDDSSGTEVLVVLDDVDIPGDGHTLAWHSLLLVHGHGRQASRLLRIEREDEWWSFVPRDDYLSAFNIVTLSCVQLRKLINALIET